MSQSPVEITIFCKTDHWKLVELHCSLNVNIIRNISLIYIFFLQMERDKILNAFIINYINIEVHYIFIHGFIVKLGRKLHLG